MNVLRPKLNWIDGRCFREYVTDELQGQKVQYEEDRPSLNDIEDSQHDDEDCISKYNIEYVNNEYRAFPQIPQPYFGCIIGAKGAVKKRLEFETKCRIWFPPIEREGNLKVFGQSRTAVAAALNRIDIIVDAARQKQPFTHFLSIPLTDPKIKDAFIEFQADVLRYCDGVRGIDPTIFQSPDKLHLTIGTMPLENGFERDKATALLQTCKETLCSFLDGNSLSLRMEGIEYMNDDPAEVDVLYAKVQGSDGSNKLQMMADKLVETFVSEGIMHRQYERVKLHTTLMNTLFRNDPTFITFSQKPQGTKPRSTFDATTILHMFKDHFFGEFELDEIHLSQRHSCGKDGYYNCTAKINLKPDQQ